MIVSFELAVGVYIRVIAFMLAGLTDWHKRVDELMPPQPTDIEDHGSASEHNGISVISAAAAASTLRAAGKSHGLLSASEAPSNHLRELGRSPLQELSPPHSSHLPM